MPQRRLAAILCADVQGYSRLMGEDEQTTLGSLTECRAVFAKFVTQYHGRIVNTPGDSILAEFGSVVDAVGAAVEVQHALAERNAGHPSGWRMDFRIGLNLGDVLVQDGDLYGDGVNIAARLQALAEPGGITVSGSVYDAVRGKLPLEFGFQGNQRVKNITNPVRAYRVRTHDALARRRWSRGGFMWRPSRRGTLLALTAAAVIAALAAGWWYRARDPVLALPSGPILAVMPFDNMSRESNDGSFADGLTEDLITELARYKDIHVLSRNCTFPYKDRTVDVRVVRKELDADYVLDGTIRRLGNSVRINVELVNAADGRNLWAEAYERPLNPGSLVSLQDEVAKRVLEALGRNQQRVYRPGLMAAVTQVPDQLDSYECVLKARHFYREQFTPGQHAQARACLEDAIARNPGYVEALTWLAGLYAVEFAEGYNEREGAGQRALETAGKAIARGPDNYLAHAHLALAMYLNKDPGYQERAAQALRLNPNDPELLASMGTLLAMGGNWPQGVALIEKSLDLTPHPPARSFLLLSTRAYLSGEGQKALGYALKAQLPGHFAVHAARARAYAMLGRSTQAAEEVRAALELYPSYPRIAERYWSRWAWNPDEARRLLEGERKAGFPIR